MVNHKELHRIHSDLFFQPHILAYDMLCKTRSFSKAGKMLGVSQSIISRRIALLEKALGIALVERGVRPLQLTNEGRQLYEMVSKEIEVIDAKLLNVLQCGEKKIYLRLGCITSLQDYFDAPMIKALSPIVSRIKLGHGTSGRLLSEFVLNELDIFISSQPYFDQENVYRKFLFAEPNVIVVPRSVELPERPTWENMRFCGIPKIGLSTRTSNGEFERQYFQKLGIRFVESVETDDMNPFFDFVDEGLGWGIVTPAFVPFENSRYRNLRVLPMPAPGAMREIYVIGRDEEIYRKLVDRIVEVAQKEIMNLYQKQVIPRYPWLRHEFSIKQGSSCI